jgi:replicative DNA helicase
MDRLYSHRSGIDALRISEGTFREQDFPVITGVMNTVREAPLNVEDRDCSTVSQIESLLRYHKLKNNIRYAAIDHVQLVQSTPDKNNRGMERKDQLDAFGSKLKDLSKALDITIFLLSQVNDAGVTFGSQMLLAHADKVIKMEIPDRKEFPAGMDEKNTRRVTVELNRSGITGSVMARFDGSTCHFGELRNNDEPEVRAQTADA